MIRLRTAAGAVGWHDAAEKEAADMVASGLWVRADSLDYSRTRNDYEIDIRRIIDEFEIEQNSELRLVEGRTPDHTLPLSAAMRNGAVMATSLNGDALEDIFVLLERGREAITGFLLLSE